MCSRLIILLSILLHFTYVNAAINPVKIRRICGSGLDNNLFWYPTTDTCHSFSCYIVWGRNGTSGNFLPLDTLRNKSEEAYIHLNANSGSGTKKWIYYIQYIDSCGPNFTVNSDTLFVDIENQTYPSYIDSVSIDPLTNRVIIGWHQNKAPDFAIYNVYGGTRPGHSTRDTFDIDSFSNPSSGILEYDLNTWDSCGNSGPFGTNPHKTIFLTVTKDTCKKTCLLTWSPYGFTFIYKGFPSQGGWKVRKYYIFKKTNALPMTLLDSVDGNVTSYLDDYIPGQQILYYIRAIKDTSILITSSSNMDTLYTRFRLDPLNTELLNVSVNEITNDQILLIFKKQTLEEWSSFDIFRSVDSINFLQTGSIKYMGQLDSIFLFYDPVDVSVSKYFYAIHSNNLCGFDVNLTRVSNSILLKAITLGNQNLLSWNEYNYWQTRVKKYIIFRGVKQNDGSITFAMLDSVLGDETIYIDKALPEQFDGQGLCYYVQAIQNPGAIYAGVSNSNHSCIIGELIIYIPNAFNPFGVNTYFRPEGSFIDYKKSSMEIYNRWGEKIIEMTNITNGWDGKDSQGKYSPQGIYLYKVNIISTNGTKQTKAGLVTLLN